MEALNHVSLPGSAAVLAASRSRLFSPSLAALRSPAPKTARKTTSGSRGAVVCAAVAAPAVQRCQLPTWAEFELGLASVYWETANGGQPSSGELLTLWFNPEAAGLEPAAEFGVGFNGGFNTPIMCGGEPRQMTRKDRGPKCASFFSMKVNVPVHARTIEFSFTNGKAWSDTFILDLQVPAKWRNQPASFFDQGLQQELSRDSACEDAIFPDSVYIQDRCLLPGGLGIEEGQSCSLDLVPGCMDKDSAFYDPLANVDDGCPIDMQPKN